MPRREDTQAGAPKRTRRGRRARRRARGETSAGVVVFNDDSPSFDREPSRTAGRRWLIVKHRKGHWGFPKGHVEPGESLTQTALRELAEEVGIAPDQVELIDGFTAVNRYRFTGKDGQRVDKTVHYFLGQSRTDRVTVSAREIDDYAWLLAGACRKRLTYHTARQVLARAAAFVEGAGPCP